MWKVERKRLSSHQRSIEWNRSLKVRPKTNKMYAIQQRLDTLYFRDEKDEINAHELLERLSYFVAKNPI